MAALSEADSRRMYSWWWDSHISPKNSKWLQENLTDINAKVKTMIKLIEEDADSFAKRAEMYYKKRPELMKLVEEFYRAYRALAERYDHATGALRQAHRSMAEAFPNQVPLLLADDSTNDISTPVRAFKQLDDLFGFGGQQHSRFAEGKSRKRLNFHHSEAEAIKVESEVETLKQAVTNLSEEKEAAVVEYKKCIESISSLEQNVAFALEEVERLKGEVDSGVVKLKGAEERCLLLERSNQSLHSELDLLMLKAESQNQELTEKERELGRLSACIEEERSHYKEAETAFNALQNLHSQAQEQLRSMEARNQSLQHELNESNKKHRVMLEGFESSVKKLRNENVILQENFQRERSEKVALLEELLEKIALLENCLMDAHDELEVLKAKSKSLEDSCQVLVKQNDNLNSQKQRLEGMDKRFMDLEEKYTALEKEKQSTLFKVEELKVSLEGQKEEQVSFSKISESRLSGIETRIRLLQEESRQKNQELVEELDRALDSQIESLVLRKCVQELEEKNSALLIECQKLVEASELSEKLISDLETENMNLKEEKNRAIEEEKFALFGEMLSFNYLALIFKNYVYERSVEMKGIQVDLKEVEIENLNLKEAIQKSEHELIAVTFVSDQLNFELVNGKNVLKQKEMELWEARWKLESKENENWELLIQVDDLKSKYNEQTNRIFKLSEDSDRLSKANQCLVEELVQLRKEHEESQNQEEKFKDLNVKVNISECENGQLKAQLDPHGPAVNCLRESISSLENHILSRTSLQKFNGEKQKDDESVTQPLAGRHQTEDKDAFLGLQDLQNRVEAIERTLTQKEQETQRENAKPKSEISEVESRCLTKDIMLDQTSECSSHGIRSSREAESQLVELWETIDHDSSIDLTVGRSNNKDIEYRQLLSVKTKSCRFRHEELNGNELELSKRLVENRREGSKRKILEKLNSDVQKLTNLQITVQDLKNKVKIIEESKKVKGNVECDSLKVELEEAEVAIDKLFDVNEKLVKSFEEKKSSAESGSVRRRRIQEQARRASEKIGRLQLEIQKIQFVLMKIDDEKESKGRGGIVLDTKRRVLLRDYIYGGVRQSPRRKKGAFCGCIQPPTRGE